MSLIGYRKEENIIIRIYVYNIMDNSEVYWTSIPDILEERHAKHSKDEHDQEEEETNIEQGRHRHDQREQKSSDTFSTFDETQDTTNLFFCVCSDHSGYFSAFHNYFDISTSYIKVNYHVLKWKSWNLSAHEKIWQ